jgi:NAD(P)-dependent dehydrogenase (short-subunit alcohol dehydrogenase family)
MMATKRSVVITGAAGGVGRACVEHFHAQGWAVLAVDLRQPEPTFAAGVKSFQADISIAAEAEALCDQLAAELGGGLAALVNNAAVQITKPLSETTPDEWDAVHAVNLRAPFLLAKGLYPHLVKAKGAVVNISSVHAMATSAEIGAYASTKGGLLALTRSMAIEFGKDGVRANVVLPGATDTPMLSSGLSRGHVSGKDLAARKADLANKILLKRLAAPEEIAKVIYFLADGEQSSYITGQSLVADGGALARLSTE